MAKYFMGIDGGTGSVRVAVFDEKGQNKGYCVVDYPTNFPKSGWAEQSDTDWWAALTQAIPGALAKSGIAAEDIAAIACDATTCTVCFLDENDQPLRPAILWMDVRAAEQAKRIDATGHDVTKFYSAGMAAESLVSKCMWVKENQPEIWAKTASVIEYLDWINFKLTGDKHTSLSLAAFRWLFDDLNGGFQQDFYESIGLEDLVGKFPGKLLRTGEQYGVVCAEAAAALGLKEGTPVIEGTLDAAACMVGVGVVKAGGMALIGGTSSCLFGLSATEFHVPGVNGTYPSCVTVGTSLVEGGQSSSGGILQWFRNNLIHKNWWDEAEARGCHIYDIVNEKVAEVPLGSEGLIMLDYFQGNRAPYSDPNARGMFWGLSMVHNTAFMARAIMEGVAYGCTHCLKTMDNAGYKVDRICACGGMAQSDVWMQIHADVSGVEIVTTKETQSAGCLGDAMICAVALGVYKDLEEAAENMVALDKVYAPDPQRHADYQFYLERYIDTWPIMRDLIHKTVDHIRK